jgi:hypothetical protein
LEEKVHGLILRYYPRIHIRVDVTSSMTACVLKYTWLAVRVSRTCLQAMRVSYRYKYMRAVMPLITSTLMMEAKTVFKMLNHNSILTWLTAQEVIIAFSHCGSFISYRCCESSH